MGTHVLQVLDSSEGRDWFTGDGHLLDKGEEAEVEQLVLPQECRRTVLELGHEIPLAGHLGKEKTRQRILRRFYWPSLYKDVEDFCQSCSTCQKSTARKVSGSTTHSSPGYRRTIIESGHGYCWTTTTK